MGKSCSGRTTKINAVTDEKGRPISFLLTAGNASDYKAAPSALLQLKSSRYLLADKAYDGDELRKWLKMRGSTPVIPNLANRLKPHPFRKKLHKQRNKIAGMFCRLKDARRIVTRYDKSAVSYLNVICLISSVYWWLN